MPRKPSPNRNFWMYAVLALATAAVYQQVRGFEFVTLDDFMYASKNPHVLNGLSLESLRWAFTTNYSANWHPVTWLSLMLDGQVANWLHPGFAHHPSAGIFHITNAVLHIANTLLLFAMLFSMTGARWRSAFVAALFALHPLHAESVAWVSERKDVLSTLLWLLTMLAYVRYARRPSRGRYALTLLAFALGLMAKPMLVTLPVVLLIMDYWPLDRIQNAECRMQIGRVLEKLPMVALAAGSSVLTVWAQNASGAVITLGAATVGERLANAAVSAMSYIGKAVSPMNLAMFYPHPGPSIPTWQVIGSAAAIAAVTVIATACRKRYPPLTAGWAWYLVTLIPVIGIVQVGSQGMADRYTYIPLIGLFFAATWLAADAFRYARSRLNSFLLTSPAEAIIALAILAGLGITSHYQVGYWRNTMTLAKHAVDVTENNYFARTILGMALHKAGRDDEALEQCVEAVRQQPKYWEAHYRLAVVLASEGLAPGAKKGLLLGALTHFRLALKYYPENADVHNDLGCLLGQIGDTKGAIKHFTLALKYQPDHEAAASNLKAMQNGLGQGSK